MPITLDQKRRLVELEGYDPSQYTTDDEGYNIIPLPRITATPAQPVVAQQVPQAKVGPIQKSTDSPITTFGKSFAQSVLPALGGGAGLGIGAALAPETGGLSFLIPLLGGIAGGALTRYGQSKIEPQSWQQNVAESAQANPIAAFGGSIAAMPLGGFYPKPSNIMSGLGAIPKLLTGMQPEAGAMMNLSNMGINAALGGAIPYAESLLTGHEMPTIPQTLGNVALGAAFSTPWALGRAYGFHDPTMSLPPQEPTAGMLTQLTPEQLAQQRVLQQKQVLAAQLDALTQTQKRPFQEAPPIIQPKQRQFDIEYQDPYKVVNKIGAEKEFSQPTEVTETPYVARKHPIEFYEEQARVQKRPLEEVLAEADQSLLRAQEQKKAIGELVRAEVERVVNARGRQQYQTTSKKGMLGGQLTQPEVRPEPIVTTELGKEIYPDYTGTTEQGNVEVKQESPADLQARQAEGLGDKYSQPSIKTAQQKENAPVLEHTAPAKGLLEWFQNLGVKRGVNLQEVEKLISSQTGQETSGVGLSVPRKLAELAKSYVKKGAWGADTPVHELIHPFFSDLRNSTHPQDRAFILKLEKSVQDNPDYVRWKAERESAGLQASPEEYITTNAGEYAILRALNTAKESPLKKWWNDYQSYLKTRFGKHATTEDFQRLLTYRLYHDKPFDATGLQANPTAGVEQEKKQEVLSTDKPEDIANKLGLTFKAQDAPAVNYTGMPPEMVTQMKQQFKPQWEFTDKRKGSDTEGITFYVPEGSSRETIEKRFAEKQQPVEQSQHESFLPKFVQPEVSKIRTVDHPQANEVADALEKTLDKQRALSGALTNDVTGKLLKHIPNLLTNPKQRWFLDTPEMQKTVQYLEDMRDYGHSNVTPNQELVKIIQDSLTKSRAEVNKYPALAIKSAQRQNADMFPAMPNRDVLETFLQSKDAAKKQQLVQEWMDYYQNTLGKTQKDAEDALEIFRDGYIKEHTDTASQFSAIDKTEDLNLPPSWRSKNMLDVMSRYNNRIARRLAYHENIESNPTIMDALNNPKSGLSSNEYVKNVLQDIQGVREVHEAKRSAVSGVVRAAMMGTLTGAKDLVTAHTLAMQHMDLRDVIPAFYSAWKDIRQNYKESLETGVNKHNIGALEFTEGEGGIDAVTENLRRFRDLENTVSGRNLLEKTSRSVDYGIGKYLAQSYLQAAIKGRMSYQQSKFLNDFAPSTWQQYKQNGNFPPEVLNEIAAKFAESVQGKYNYAGLPSLAQKGTFAPYLSLARWSIEKMNNFDKYVLVPAKHGNVKPLLMSTLGMVLGGEAVNKLVETMTKRKEKTPSFSELRTLGEEGELTAKPLLYKFAALASYSGYAGVLGDIAKMAMDKLNKNNVQSYNNPLIGAMEVVSQNASDVVDALENGDMNVTADAISQFLEDTFQVYRLALTHLSPEKMQKIEEQNKYRDLKNFRVTHGVPVANVTKERANPFKDKDIKAFKKTSSIEEAAQMLPQLIQDAMEKSNGDPERLKAEFAKLKANNYQTFPSPEELPIQFVKYMSWLSQTQGAEEASKRLFEYLYQNELNKAKSSAVPTL